VFGDDPRQFPKVIRDGIRGGEPLQTFTEDVVRDARQKRFEVAGQLLHLRHDPVEDTFRLRWHVAVATEIPAAHFLERVVEKHQRGGQSVDGADRRGWRLNADGVQRAQELLP
jgi:hypothetical protein